MIAKPELSGSDIALDVVFTPQEYKKTISSLVGTASVHDGALYCDDSGDYATLIETPVNLYFKIVFNPDSVTLCYPWATTGTIKELTITNGVASMTGFTLYTNGEASATGIVVAGQDNTVIGIPTSAYTYTAIKLGEKLAGSISQFTIYRTTKTLNEISNDYENKTHRELQTNSEFLRVDARNGWIENTYVDDQVGTELVTNGNNESAKCGLSEIRATSSQSSTQAKNGSYSYKVVADSSNNTHYSRLLLSVNNIHTISGYAYLPSGQTVTTLYYGYDNSGDFQYTKHSITTTDSWVYFQFSIPANATYSYFTIGGETGSYENDVWYLDDISIKVVVPPVTNTAVTLARDGAYAMSYNGTTSKLDMGAYNNLTGDITAWALIKPRSQGEGNLGRLYDNGKFIVYIDSSNRIAVTSDGGTIIRSAVNGIVLNIWQLAIATRTSAGVANIYINGVLSGSADQASGTPSAVSITNLFMGNNNAGTATFDGLIMAGGIETGIWTAAQCIQAWTALKGFVQ